MGVDVALLGAEGNAGRIRVAGKKIGQSQDVGVGDRGIVCPGPEYAWTGAEVEGPAAAPVVIEVDIGAAILKTEAQLVLAHRPGERIRNLAGDVFTARGRRDADRVKAVDGDLRSAGQSAPVLRPAKVRGFWVCTASAKSCIKELTPAATWLVRLGLML